jgi:hypothetical protein
VFAASLAGFASAAALAAAIASGGIVAVSSGVSAAYAYAYDAGR